MVKILKALGQSGDNPIYGLLSDPENIKGNVQHSRGLDLF
jgi:hypothetical protein